MGKKLKGGKKPKKLKGVKKPKNLKGVKKPKKSKGRKKPLKTKGGKKARPSTGNARKAGKLKAKGLKKQRKTYWTKWINDYDPYEKGAIGDLEQRTLIEPVPCGGELPLKAQCKLDPQGKQPCKARKCNKKQVFKCNVQFGLKCMHAKQRKIGKYQCQCCNRKIRFMCPAEASK